MQVGDLITHNPTGAVGIIVEDKGHSIRVLWCFHPAHKTSITCSTVSKLFIEVKR